MSGPSKIKLFFFYSEDHSGCSQKVYFFFFFVKQMKHQSVFGKKSYFLPFSVSLFHGLHKCFAALIHFKFFSTN